MRPVGEAGSVHVTPATRDRSVAEDWFRRFEGAGLDGVVAKASDLAYVAGKRVMVKVKHERTAEFVVGGFRWYKAASAEGCRRNRVAPARVVRRRRRPGPRRRHRGVPGRTAAPTGRGARAVPGERRAKRARKSHPWAGWATMAEASATRMPGARSRWNATKDLSFEPLRPVLVVEAAYEHLQGNRLRHTAQFRRWRPDRVPTSCTYEQLDVAVPVELAAVFGAGVALRGCTGRAGRD